MSTFAKLRLGYYRKVETRIAKFHEHDKRAWRAHFNLLFSATCLRCIGREYCSDCKEYLKSGYIIRIPVRTIDCPGCRMLIDIKRSAKLLSKTYGSYKDAALILRQLKTELDQQLNKGV